jgi:hypothetical protein
MDIKGYANDAAGQRFLDGFVAAGRELNTNQKYCTEWLRKHFNIEAEHPDDGWVNRVKGFFGLSYPAFRGNVKVDSLVAFGSPQHSKGGETPVGRYRIARVTTIEPNMLGMLRYQYQPVTSQFYIYRSQNQG